MPEADPSVSSRSAVPPDVQMSPTKTCDREVSWFGPVALRASGVAVMAIDAV